MPTMGPLLAVGLQYMRSPSSAARMAMLTALAGCQSTPLEWGNGNCSVPGYANLGTYVVPSPSDRRLTYICLEARIVDANPSTADLELDCIVDLFLPKIDDVSTPSTSACLTGDSSEWTRTRIPRCDTVAASAPCWKVTIDTTRCSVRGQLVDIINYSALYTPAGTRLSFQCRVCPDPDAGISSQPGCA
jgi:hypothetical protein